jgi:hypothetical protein
MKAHCLPSGVDASTEALNPILSPLIMAALRIWTELLTTS